MTEHRQVMVATDLSARCDRAVDRGVMLARDWNSKFAVAHILSDDASETAAVEKVREILPDPEMDALVLIDKGSVPEALQRLASKIEANLILTGVARYNSAGDYLLGTAVDQCLIRN